jgi:hypothetical protein
VQPEEPLAADIVADDAKAEDPAQDDDGDDRRSPEVVVRLPAAGLQPTSEMLRSVTAPITAALQQQLRSITQATLHQLPVIRLSKIEFPAITALQGQLTRTLFAQQPPVFPRIEFPAITALQGQLTRTLFAQQPPVFPRIGFPAITALQGQLTRVLSGIDFDAIKRALQRGCPPNWEGVDAEHRLSLLVDITEAGLPTAWVPRASVLQELIATDQADRPDVFARRRQEVIEDCRTVLRDVTSAELAEHVEALGEALDAAEAGKLRASQALAASIFDTILRHTIKPERIWRYYDRVKAEITARHENASIAELRWGLAYVPAVAALDVFDQSKGHPIPTRFNRHACAHAVGRVQYTPANAVIAIAIATSMVRETHEQIVDADDAVA